MAKITLDDITSSFASTSLFQSNFTAIEDELNDKVLYRDNPTGEADVIYTSQLSLDGTLVTVGDNVIQNTFNEVEFTNSLGVDTFAVNYTIGFVVVTLNGVELAAADFTASNGTSIVLASPLYP